MKYSEPEKIIIRTIGDFFFTEEMNKEIAKHPNLHNGITREITDEIKDEAIEENYNIYHNTQKRIYDLQITRVEYDPKTSIVSITLHWPGMLIGERGKDITALGEYLKRIDKNIKIHIIEDHLYDYLVPMDYSDYDY